MKNYLLILTHIVPIVRFTQKCKTKYKNVSSNIEIYKNGNLLKSLMQLESLKDYVS